VVAGVAIVIRECDAKDEAAAGGGGDRSKRVTH